MGFEKRATGLVMVVALVEVGDERASVDD